MGRDKDHREKWDGDRPDKDWGGPTSLKEQFDWALQLLPEPGILPKCGRCCLLGLLVLVWCSGFVCGFTIILGALFKAVIRH